MSLLSLLVIFSQTPSQALTPAPTVAPTQSACECSGEDCKWKPPAKCAPSFTYKGEVYHGCSMTDSHRAWCSHHANHTNQWSFCGLSCEDGCHEQQMPAACIAGNGPAIGHADEACDCMHATCAWMPPAACSANFTYHGSNYSGCALVDDVQAWCAHSKMYQPKEWSHCRLRCPEGCYWHHPRGCLKKTVEVRLPVNNVCWEPSSSCAPKFSYKGQEYAGCTTADSGPHAWCSYSYQYNKKSWDFCKAHACCNATTNVAVVPEKPNLFLTTARSLQDLQQQNFPHQAVAGLSSSSGGTACECSGEDCKWKLPAKCTPSFTYKGEAYHGCSMADSHRAWCSHHANHTNQWSFCELSCEDGCHEQQMPAACIPGNGPAIGHADEACDCMHATCAWMPPVACSENFTYHGSNYSGCALVDDAQAWCAHNKMYQPKEWSHCRLRCPEGCYWHHPRGCLKKTVEVRLPVNSVCWEPLSSCAPKFRYKGQEYAGCTTADSGTHPWCSHKHEYKQNSWDYCKAHACCNRTQNFTLVREKAHFSMLTTVQALKHSQQHSLSNRAIAGLCLSSILGGGFLIAGVVVMRAAKTTQEFERIDYRSNLNFNNGGLVELE